MCRSPYLIAYPSSRIPAFFDMILPLPIYRYTRFCYRTHTQSIFRISHTHTNFDIHVLLFVLLAQLVVYTSQHAK